MYIEGHFIVDEKEMEDCLSCGGLGWIDVGDCEDGVVGDCPDCEGTGEWDE